MILDALDRLMEGRTTIMIAHRLSTVRSVDEILVLDDGEFVQRGTHDELVAEDGLYRQLWEAQTGAEERGPEAPQRGPSPARSSPRRALERARGGRRAAVAARPAPTAAGAARDPAERKAAAALAPRPKIVLLGMLTKIPVGGVAWLVGQYATGFERLGYEVYYVEAHARTPVDAHDATSDDGAGKAAAYIAEDRRALRARATAGRSRPCTSSGRCYGMSAEQLDRLYRDAALIINMHGGTLPLPEHAATDRLVFLGHRPGRGRARGARAATAARSSSSTSTSPSSPGASTTETPTAGCPGPGRYAFIPSPPPVVLDFWENDVVPDGAPFTTIGNWRQPYRDVRIDGRVYSWSKHQQFLKVLDLPSRTGRRSSWRSRATRTKTTCCSPSTAGGCAPA